MKSVLTILFFYFAVLAGAAGQDTSLVKRDTMGRYHLLNMVTRNGESLPEIELEEAVIKGKRVKGGRYQLWRYDRLVYNVKKVYPYSIVIRDMLQEVNTNLANYPDEKKRKEYLKKVEKEAFKDYEDDMRRMSVTQGKILIKLVDRETSNTSYELIKEYRSGVTATFWQGIARIFGTNLKDRYDADGEDYMIELIIYEIEMGRL